MLRTHYCAKVNKEHIGQTISACGWVNSYRDHSNVWFVDLRDTTGLLQVVIDKKQFPESNKLRNEFCIRVTGEVVYRGDDAINPKLESGEVEVHTSDFEILSESPTPPFQLTDEVSEDLRLKYRYIDLTKLAFAFKSSC